MKMKILSGMKIGLKGSKDVKTWTLNFSGGDMGQITI